MINGARNFKLRNATGAELDISQQGMFLWEPEGLGWGMTPSVENVGNSYILTDSLLIQPMPYGKMVFKGYKEYNTFLSFVQVGRVVLCYKPLNTWYYLDCFIDIDKSEIKPSTNRLICPVAFTGISTWYEEVASYRASVSDNVGKVYTYTYPYIYGLSKTGVAIVKNGALESYMKITIIGPAVNPQWRLYNGGEQIATGKVNITLSAGRKLIVDSHPATMQIAEYTTENVFIANRYADSDFTTQRIFALPPDENQIIFTDDNGAVTTAFVEVRKRV